MSVTFKVTKKDLTTIEKIAHRAVKMADNAGWQYDEKDAQMDIAACHCNGNPMYLSNLLDAEDFDFAHDVFGIRMHLDRSTGKLKDFFSPRHSIQEEMK